MLRSFLKLGFWFVIGVGSITALLGNTSFETPWKYSVHSVIPVGAEITLTQPNGELVTMSVPEGQAISAKKTFDVGAPLTLACVYLLGSIMAFGLKAKNKPTCTGP